MRYSTELLELLEETQKIIISTFNTEEIKIDYQGENDLRGIRKQFKDAIVFIHRNNCYTPQLEVILKYKPTDKTLDITGKDKKDCIDKIKQKIKELL